MSDTVLKVIQERQSSRIHYDSQRKISEKNLEQIVEAARWAPTAHNMQNFEIIAIDDDGLLQRIGKIRSRISEVFLKESYEQFSFSKRELRKKGTGVLGAMFPLAWQHPKEFHKIALGLPRPLSESLQGSPLVLIIVYDPRKRAPASKGDFLGIISLGCAMENILLAAQSLRISAQVLSVFSSIPVERKLKQITGIPNHLKIAYAIRLGYPPKGLDAKKHFRIRRRTEAFVHRNNW
jgi:nitroreductase